MQRAPARAAAHEARQLATGAGRLQSEHGLRHDRQGLRRALRLLPGRLRPSQAGLSRRRRPSDHERRRVRAPVPRRREPPAARPALVAALFVNLAIPADAHGPAGRLPDSAADRGERGVRWRSQAGPRSPPARHLPRPNTARLRRRHRGRGEAVTEVRCFFVVESGRATQALRRYRRSTLEKCAASGHGYHNSSTRIEDVEAPAKTVLRHIAPTEFKNDPRWPTRCACGYEFTADDEWQVFTETIYRNEATGQEWPMRELPPGAMYDGWWLRDGIDKPKGVGPDGLCLMVCLPPGGGLDYWHVDGPANNGPGWQR